MTHHFQVMIGCDLQSCNTRGLERYRPRVNLRTLRLGERLVVGTRRVVWDLFRSPVRGRALVGDVFRRVRQISLVVDPADAAALGEPDSGEKGGLRTVRLTLEMRGELLT